MVERHADVLALYGLWIGTGLLFAAVAPLAVLGFGSGMTLAAGIVVLAGIVFVGQGALLCASADRYVGRPLVPEPLGWFRVEKKPGVYLVGVLALVLGALFVYAGARLLWLWVSLFP